MSAKAAVLLLAWCSVASAAAGQTLPSEPITFGGGRVVIGGDAAVGIAPADTGFFNYSDYEHSTLRNIRFGVSGSVRANDRLSVLGELRVDNLTSVTPFALYARVRPFPGRRLDVQIGRIPPTFGSFTRHAYSNDNPLVGYPLGYQYLTSLRADSVPANADELLFMRGRGWLSNFSIGNVAPDRGLPLVTSFSWDTGVQVTTGWKFIDVTAAVTNGTLSDPRVDDDNSGKQFAGRVTARPTAGWVLGASAARGQFGRRSLIDAVPAPEDRRFIQTAYGADVEYSRDYFVVRADVVLSEWAIPAVSAPFIDRPLRAGVFSVEGRYAFLPGMYLAARGEHLAFNRITGSRLTNTWDANVTRVEVGGGFYLQRNLVARLSIQVNRRDGGRVPNLTLPAAQLLYWF